MRAHRLMTLISERWAITILKTSTNGPKDFWLDNQIEISASTLRVTQAFESAVLIWPSQTNKKRARI